MKLRKSCLFYLLLDVSYFWVYCRCTLWQGIAILFLLSPAVLLARRYSVFYFCVWKHTDSREGALGTVSSYVNKVELIHFELFLFFTGIISLTLKMNRFDNSYKKNLFNIIFEKKPYNFKVFKIILSAIYTFFYFFSLAMFTLNLLCCCYYVISLFIKI